MSGEQVVPQWIEASLFERLLSDIVPNIKQIKEFQIKKALGAGENYNTVIIYLNFLVELNDNILKFVSLFLKTAEVNESFRTTMDPNNVFNIETTMYKKIIPEFVDITDEYGLEVTFGAKYYEIGTENPYILLENLFIRGFKNVNCREGLDMNHTKAVLKKLAQWHAASAAYVFNRGQFKQHISTGSFKEHMRDKITAMHSIFLQITKTFEENEEYFEALCKTQNNLIDEMIESSKVDANEFNVLNHGDCWSNNIMFKYDIFGYVEETYFVDFQTPKYGSPAQDLYYFILSSVNYEIKIKEFDYLIRYYHSRLVVHLKLFGYLNIPSLSDIHIMLYKYGIWGYLTASTIMAVALMDFNENDSIENLTANTDQFKTRMYSNPRYRKHMKLVLPWLYNRGAFNT